MFFEFASLLSKDFTVYALDSRGHGESDSVEHLSYEEMAEMASLGSKVLHTRSVLL